MGEKLKINKMYKFDWIKGEMELEQIITKAEKVKNAEIGKFKGQPII